MSPEDKLLNQSYEAIKLREAAMDFGAHSADHIDDPHDRKGVALNLRLLRAALVYAKRVKEAPETWKLDRKIKKLEKS